MISRHVIAESLMINLLCITKKPLLAGAFTYIKTLESIFVFSNHFIGNSAAGIFCIKRLHFGKAF